MVGGGGIGRKLLENSYEQVDKPASESENFSKTESQIGFLAMTADNGALFDQDSVMLNDTPIAEASEGGHAVPARNPLSNNLQISAANKRRDPPPSDFIG